MKQDKTLEHLRHRDPDTFSEIYNAILRSGLLRTAEPWRCAYMDLLNDAVQKTNITFDYSQNLSVQEDNSDRQTFRFNLHWREGGPGQHLSHPTPGSLFHRRVRATLAAAVALASRNGCPYSTRWALNCFYQFLKITKCNRKELSSAIALAELHDTFHKDTTMNWWGCMPGAEKQDDWSVLNLPDEREEPRGISLIYNGRVVASNFQEIQLNRSPNTPGFWQPGVFDSMHVVSRDVSAGSISMVNGEPNLIFDVEHLIGNPQTIYVSNLDTDENIVVLYNAFVSSVEHQASGRVNIRLHFSRYEMLNRNNEHTQVQSSD